MNDMQNFGTILGKPRIALMGEFSAGKSTLSNLMLGTRPLPERVTATQLPPVWLAYGRDAPFREAIDGSRHPVDLTRLDDVPLEDTLYIKVFLETDILGLCDLIDMPGISDPNMPPEVWERMAGAADGVIWCTHATQAWRQSEAAAWEMMSEEVKAQSILLVTRIDKVVNERDRVKLMRRVNAATEGQFGAVFPVSLLDAAQAGDDWEIWKASGAEAFTEYLIDAVQMIEATAPPVFEPVVRSAPILLENPVLPKAAEPEPASPSPDVVESAAPVMNIDAAFEAEIDDHMFDDAFEAEFDDNSDNTPQPEPQMADIDPTAPPGEAGMNEAAPTAGDAPDDNEFSDRALSITPRRVRKLAPSSDEMSARPRLSRGPGAKPLVSLTELPNLKDLFSGDADKGDAGHASRRVAGD